MSLSEPINVILTRLHAGDRDALSQIVSEFTPWVEKAVRRGLSDDLRGVGDTTDHVQDVFIRVLTTKTKFVVDDADQFKRILLRMIRNTLTDAARHMRAQRRDRARERQLSGSVLLFDQDQPTPSAVASLEEEQAILEFAMELLEPETRQIVMLRDWEQFEYAEIGEEIGTSQETARQRYHLARAELARKVRVLSEGRLEDAL